MKSSKGITLVSLMIYIIALSIVIGVIATFTRYFYRNSNEASYSLDASEKYARVVEYLTDDVNYNEFDDVVIDDTNIIFYIKNGGVHKYYYDNGNIYFISWNSSGEKEALINLCDGAESFSVVSSKQDRSKIKLTITTKINGIEYKNVFVVK